MFVHYWLRWSKRKGI